MYGQNKRFTKRWLNELTFVYSKAGMTKLIIDPQIEPVRFKINPKARPSEIPVPNI